VPLRNIKPSVFQIVLYLIELINNKADQLISESRFFKEKFSQWNFLNFLILFGLFDFIIFHIKMAPRYVPNSEIWKIYGKAIKTEKKKNSTTIFIKFFQNNLYFNLAFSVKKS